MEFKDLKIGDTVYILENTGTFRKITTYNIGNVINVSLPYDDNTINNLYLLLVLKKKLVDITISCEGVLKRLTVGADKTTITDTTIGLTVSTSKDELVTLLKQLCKEWEGKIALITNYQQELEKCKRMLDLLDDNKSPELFELNGTIKVS